MPLEIKPDLREDAKRFWLLVFVNGFVGTMEGLVRAMIPELANWVESALLFFRIDSLISVLTSIKYTAKHLQVLTITVFTMRIFLFFAEITERGHFAFLCGDYLSVY